jgi:elongator complex protein 3
MAEELEKEPPETKEQVQKLKQRVLRRFPGFEPPTDADILSNLSPQHQERFRDVLRLKRSRTLSGVTVVAVMTPPSPCPHGTCTYCPGGMEKGTPQSYTGWEPAALRGSRNEHDPYLQVLDRLSQYTITGHPVDKIDMIIMGGTFTSRPWEEQVDYLRGCYAALNEFEPSRHVEQREQAEKELGWRGLGQTRVELTSLQSTNGSAQARCIGLTFETRPDQVTPEMLQQLLQLGTTRVELGVQSLRDQVLEQVERGHGLKQTVTATSLIRDHGLKVCYHMMPGLPGTSLVDDEVDLRTLYEDSAFMPDMLKIYPCLVMEDTPLYDLWEAGEFEPIEEEELIPMLGRVKSTLPSWTRVMRVQRDIPAPLIKAGVKSSNLRQMVQGWMSDHQLWCGCLRCREAGRFPSVRLPNELYTPMIRQYKAGGGLETFLSFEADEDTKGNPLQRPSVLGFLRLRMTVPALTRLIEGKSLLEAERLPDDPVRTEQGLLVPVVRELRVYGEERSIGQKGEGAGQHIGTGVKLLRWAERIAKQKWGSDALAITSGVGVRPYYERTGYRLVGSAMVKNL